MKKVNKNFFSQLQFCTMTLNALSRGAAAPACAPIRMLLNAPYRCLTQTANENDPRAQARRLPTQSRQRSTIDVSVAAAASSPSPAQPPPSPPPPKIDDPAASLTPFLRAAPLYLAAGGMASVLVNRFLFSGGGGAGRDATAVALDAASAQSRAELLAVALAAVLALTGLQWLTIAPKTPEAVSLEDFEVLSWTRESLPPRAAEELRWAADSLREAAPSCVALGAFVDGRCVAAVGSFKRGSGSDPSFPAAAASFAFGDVCTRAAESQSGTYLANLTLYPGRGEFLSSLFAAGTQGVVVAPAGRVLLVAATNVVRGFAAVDQAWVATVAEKVDSSVDGWNEGKEG